MTYEEKTDFLQYIKEHKVYSKYYDEIYILFYTGMRVSELCGLTFDEIDFENNVINLDHQLLKGKNGYYVSSLKGKLTSKKCRSRTIPMLKGVNEALQRIIARRPAMEKEMVIKSEDTRVADKSGFLILSQTKTPKSARLYENYFQDICEDYNNGHPEHLLEVTPHLCRHTFCTALAMEDVNPIKLQKIMGHTDLKTTANYYKEFDMQKVAREMQILNDRNW